VPKRANIDRFDFSKIIRVLPSREVEQRGKQTQCDVRRADQQSKFLVMVRPKQTEIAFYSLQFSEFVSMLLDRVDIAPAVTNYGKVCAPHSFKL
jgi:hypothetical protein